MVLHLETLSPVALVDGLDHPIEHAVRPEGLAGRKVALVWNAKANGNRLLEQWIQPLLDLGAEPSMFTGAFPCPDATFDQVLMQTDLAIIAVGDCGASAGWTAHDIFRFERAGTPAVGVVAGHLMSDVEAMAKARGLMHAPFVGIDRGLSGASEVDVERLARLAFPEIVHLLTSPPPQWPSREAEGGERTHFESDSPTELFRDFQAEYLRLGWGDGFPLIPPTAESVSLMMGPLADRRDAVVCVLPPGNGIATVEKVAINAVMAGCLPEHFPVVVTAVRAISEMGDPGIRMGTSGGPLAPLLVINGPIAGKLGINAGTCALGPGRESAPNIAIGRAVRLAMMNIGHCYPGSLDPDTIGSARKFSQCLAENEPTSPWEPLHVEKGLNPAKSAVTVFCVWSESSGAAIWATTAEAVLDSLAYEEARPGGWYLVQAFGGEDRSDHGILVLLSPEHAEIVGREGWGKSQVKRYLWQRSTVPAARLLHKWAAITERLRPEWRWLQRLSGAELDSLWLHAQESPDHFDIVVAGGAAPYDSIFGTFGKPVTLEVEGVYASIR